MRRGWCPGLARPMATGDGLLVRLHPANGVLTAARLRAVAAGARESGNGLVDVTARGNLQMRGVRPETRAALAHALTAAGLGDARAPGGPHPDGPQRLTLATPLAGLDPGARCDAFGLAAAIEAAALPLAGLHPKLLVALEDGGATGLGAVDADLHLAPDAAGRLVLALTDEPGGHHLTPNREADEIGALLHRLAAGGPRRVRDLGPAERAGLTAGLPATARPAPPPPLAPGLPLAGALALELPFGRGDAALLDTLATWAERHGDGTLRLTPQRGLVLPGLAAPERLRDAAARQGLIVAPADPRRAVAACPGAPACASGHAPAQPDALRLAAALGPASGARVHVSGCAKGCAHPGPADLTLVGLIGGGYGLVPGGRAGDAPVARLSLDAILVRLSAPGGADPAKTFAAPAESA